jgi:hypothetical protein
MKPFTPGGCGVSGSAAMPLVAEGRDFSSHHLIPLVYIKVFTGDATVSAATRFCIVFYEVCLFKPSVKMNAEAEISNFDAESFIDEVLSRVALWDMNTEAYSNRDLKKNKTWEELVDIFMNKATATMCRKYLSLIGLLRLVVPKISVSTAFTQTGEQKN